MGDRVFTFKVNGYSAGGYGVQFEVHDAPLNRIKEIVGWWDAQLADLGVKGVILSAEDRAEHQAAQKETKVCPIHKVEMLKHTKGKSVWYSHKLEDGSWCRGETNGG